MDIETQVMNLSPDTEFTDKYGRRHKVKYTGISWVETPKGGIYVDVVGQGYPEFYMFQDPVLIHVPDAKFKPGDWVIARNGKGDVYHVDRVSRDDHGVYYMFDNGSVHIAKRGRSGLHYADRADRGYKLVKD